MKPWRLVQRRTGGAFAPSNGLTLRSLAVDTGRGCWTTNPVQTGGYTEEMLAEGKAIAAVPDLVNACEEVLCWARTPGNHGGVNPYMLEFVKTAESALSKVNG